jgi:hypothetical protein
MNFFSVISVTSFAVDFFQQQFIIYDGIENATHNTFAKETWILSAAIADLHCTCIVGCIFNRYGPQFYKKLYLSR